MALYQDYYQDSAVPPEQTCHPCYRKHGRTWRDQRAAYHGGDLWYGTNQNRYSLGGITITRASTTRLGESTPLEEFGRLWRHEREKDQKYRRRQRASVYANFVKPLVDMMASTVAKAAKKVKLPPQLDYLEDDVDGRGTDLTAFRRQLIIAAIKYGHCYVLIELPDGPPQPSLYHQLASGAVPHARLVEPLDLIDWSWNGSTFEWCEVREYRPQARDRGQKEDEILFATKVYYPGHWERFEKGVLVEEGAGPAIVPMVPFILNRDPCEAEPIGVSPIRDVVDLAEQSFNKRSWLTEQQQNQCFNTVFIASEDPIDSQMDLTLGTQTYISGGTDMKFVAPDVAPLEHLAESMRQDYQQAKSILGIETISEQSAEAQSGIALQMSRENLDAVLGGFSAPAESAERNWLKLAAVLVKANPETVLVEYSHDFSALSATGRFAMLTTAIEKGGFTGKAKAELQKQLFMATYPDAEQDVIDEVFADIEESAAALEMMPLPGMAPPEDEEMPDEDGPPPMPGKMGAGMRPGKGLPFGNGKAA